MFIHKLLAATCMFFLFLPTSVLANSKKPVKRSKPSQLKGKVVDISFNPVPDAEVTLKFEMNENEKGTRTQTTNNQGEFNFENISSYKNISIEVSKNGFQAREFKKVKVDQNEREFVIVPNNLVVGGIQDSPKPVNPKPPVAGTGGFEIPELPQLAQQPSLLPLNVDCMAITTIKPKSGFDIVEVDSNTGEILEGSTSYAENKKICLIFTKKNPFKYRYRITTKVSSLDQSVIQSGLGLILSEFKLDLPLGSSQSSVPRSSKIIDDITKFQEMAKKSLADTAKAYSETKKKYEDFQRETSVDDITPQVAICNKAQQIYSSLGGLTAAISDSKKALELFFKSIKDNEANLDSESLKAFQEIALKLADQFKKGLPIWQEGDKSFHELAGLIYKVLNSSDSFYEIKYPSTQGESKQVTVDIKRTPLRIPDAKEEQLALISIQVGQSRFSISAGIGFSTISDIKIVSQQSLIPDGRGGQMLGARFGFSNGSSFKPSGVALLNAHLFDVPSQKFPFSVALSTGIVLANRGESNVSTEFIAGPSLGFLNNKLFTTFGFHAARVDQLGGGFKIGDPVPAGLASDSFPIQKIWRKGFILAITYRIR